MKGTKLFAFALLGMVTAVGAGASPANEQANPRQAGASSVYLYEVAATDTHGPGKLMIDIGQRKFVFNGKDFDPSKVYALAYSRPLSTDLRVFASAVATGSGNLHVAGTWAADAALPDASDVGVVTATIYPGTIQRLSTLTQPCYTLIYSDPYQSHTVYLPANEITYAAGGSPLPGVISTAAAVDYVTIDSDVTHTLSFRYQGTYYTARFYVTCPETPQFVYELKYYATCSEEDGLWVGGDFTARNTATGEVIHVPGTAYVYYFHDPTPLKIIQNDGEWRLAGPVHTDFSPWYYYDFQAFWWIMTAIDVKITFHPDDPTVPQVTAYPSSP